METDHSRRALLKLGASVGISGGFAGCTSVFAKPPELRIRNHTSEKTAIFVRVSSAITGERYVDDEFRIPAGGPHMLAKEVFPTGGEYDVCARTEGISAQCETWNVEHDHPEYHITLNPASDENEHQFTMGQFEVR